MPPIVSSIVIARRPQTRSSPLSATPPVRRLAGRGRSVHVVAPGPYGPTCPVVVMTVEQDVGSAHLGGRFTGTVQARFIRPTVRPGLRRFGGVRRYVQPPVQA